MRLTHLTPEQILSLAPTPALVRMSRQTARLENWSALGQQGDRVWGMVSQYNTNNFQVHANTREMTFTCTCRSITYPCPHALGLLLLAQEYADHFAAQAPPADLPSLPAPPPPRSPHSTLHRRQRLARITAGLQTFDIWLADRLREGLATLPQKPKSFWNDAANQLVDAQAGQLARQIRQWPHWLRNDNAWPSRLLAHMGRLHLLARGFEQFTSLPASNQADLRQAVGLPAQDFGRIITDKWFVLARVLERQGKVRRLRIWLWGEASQQPALLSEIIRDQTALNTTLLPGLAYPTALHFRPGSVPLQAALRHPLTLEDCHQVVPPIAPPARSIAAAWQDYTNALAQNPWLDLYPFLLHGVMIVQEAGRWWLQDSAGDRLPLAGNFDRGWHLLALHGGCPLTLFGEWDGEQLHPQAVQSDSRWLSLTLLPPLAKQPGRATRTPEPARPSPWPELVNMALVGATRASLPALPAGLPPSTHDDPAQQLLDSAAALTLYQQVGQLPATGAPLPATRYQVTDAVPSATYPQALTQILDGRFRECLGECLELMADTGQSTPPEMLPQVLEEGRKLMYLRPRLLPLLGQHGRWLAGQNPAWTYAAKQIESWEGLCQYWQASDQRTRYALVYQLRHTRPEAARALATAFWKEESQQQRTAQLALWEHGLSLADEPFLETVLDDRHHLVRGKAAELLSRLPKSRLAQRLSAHLPAVVRWQSTPSPRITLRYPPLDAALQRDGIIPGSTPREQSRALNTLLSLMPLDAWLTAGPDTPAALLRTIAEGKWRHTLTTALVTATLRQQNPLWAEAILTHLPLTSVTVKLVAYLPAAQCEQLLTQTMAAPLLLDKNSPAIALVRQWRWPWNEALGRQWLTLLAQVIRLSGTTGPADSLINLSLPSFARTFPPALAAEAAAILRPLVVHKVAWDRPVERFLSMLHFRATMHEGIR